MQQTAWHNPSGKPLSSPEWLDAHHHAKLSERADFARRLADLKPSRIVDLGCGSGQWLSLLDSVLDAECELIGIDLDADSIEIARTRSAHWNRAAQFIVADFLSCPEVVPEADLILMFNMIPYIEDPLLLISSLKAASSDGVLAIRQYDGFTIRFGPMKARTRVRIEDSLFVAVSNSSQFDHYSLDRAFEAVSQSPYRNRSIEFEFFQRVSPFDGHYLKYLELTFDWLQQYLSEDSRKELMAWRRLVADASASHGIYSYEVDLVAILS